MTIHPGPATTSAAVATPVVVLGRLGPPPLLPAPDVRRRLLYVGELDMVVLPYSRAAGQGWHCAVVATRAPRATSHITLSDARIGSASAALVVSPEQDPDGYARLLWPTRVFQRWPGGILLAYARLLAERLRPAGSLRIPAGVLDNHAWIAARLPTTRPPGVDRLTDHLATDGFLTHAEPDWWHLTLPAVYAPTVTRTDSLDDGESARLAVFAAHGWGAQDG